jgi:hypothetical protein
MNDELKKLYDADIYEHAHAPRHGTPAYRAMRERDRERREQVAKMMAAASLTSPEDYFHAARIFQHGDTPEEAWTAHQLALQSSQLGHRPARWMAAAAYDRWLVYQGRPQKYGTQYVSDGKRQRLWDVEPDTTDLERAEWDVPPLAEQLRKAEEATRNHPPTPVAEDAPQWLLDALHRWQSQEADSSQPPNEDVKRSSLSLQQAFSFAWSTFKKHYGLFTLIMLTLLGAWLALEIVVVASQGFGVLWWAAAHLVFFVLFAGLEAGFLQVCLALHDGKAVSFIGIFASLNQGPRFFAAQCFYLAIVLLGLVLLIVPGFYLATRYALYAFPLVSKSTGLIASFRKSAALSRGAETSLLFLLTIQILLNILGASVLGLGLIITVPLSVLMMTSAYRQLDGI